MCLQYGYDFECYEKAREEYYNVNSKFEVFTIAIVKSTNPWNVMHFGMV
jgi:hypothetical protein